MQKFCKEQLAGSMIELRNTEKLMILTIILSRPLLMNTNVEAFLLSTFSEFVKLWRSRKNSRLFVESVNGSAFISFLAFVGYPKNVRRTQSSQSQRNPKKKSSRKIQRDNNCAANFQERKRQEEAAATAARGNPHAPITSSST